MFTPKHSTRLLTTIAFTLLCGCANLTITKCFVDWRADRKEVLIEISNEGYRGPTYLPLGSSDAENFIVRVKGLQPSMPRTEPEITFTIDRLANGDSRTIYVDFQALANASNQYLQNVKKIEVIVDYGNRVREASEFDNQQVRCAQPSFMPTTGWVVDWCPQPADIDLIVRTANMKGAWPHKIARLKGTAQEFYLDWPLDMGISGLQEVPREVWCPSLDETVHACHCFAELLASEFNTQYEASWFARLGIVAGSNWVHLSHNAWVLGTDSLKLFPQSFRYLLEKRLQRFPEGWLLRFYSTHLSHGDQEDQRNEQIDRLVAIIRAQSSANELPPVVVGDFNFTQEPSSFNRMNTHFELMNNAGGKDQIWIGRKASFPNSIGHFEKLRYTTIDLSSDHRVDDYVGPLSDHDARAICFKIHLP